MGARSSSSGFTLMELLLVVVLIALVAGIGSLGIDSFDRGPSTSAPAVLAFIEASRERARASGQMVELRPLLDPAGVERLVYRSKLEAHFDATPAQSWELVGNASLTDRGRLGRGVALVEEGAVRIPGRGVEQIAHGCMVEFDLQPVLRASGRILTWDGFLSLEGALDGSLHLQATLDSNGVGAAVDLRSPPGTLLEGRWHRIRIAVGSGAINMRVDGRLVSSEVVAGGPAKPRSEPWLGGSQGSYPGRYDEFRLWARQAEPGPLFSDGAGLAWSGSVLRFDRDGLLDAYHAEALELVLHDYGEAISRFRVGRFATEELAP